MSAEGQRGVKEGKEGEQLEGITERKDMHIGGSNGMAG
jgi:hypothetical protein